MNLNFFWTLASLGQLFSGIGLLILGAAGHASLESAISGSLLFMVGAILSHRSMRPEYEEPDSQFKLDLWTLGFIMTLLLIPVGTYLVLRHKNGGWGYALVATLMVIMQIGYGLYRGARNEALPSVKT